ncbi:phosphatidylserine/phosphatidylglycerophosphate/cardiolipin synthase family protein [Streptomyces sp. NPDC059866]|uniref:phospholipase D-like domain-containing protein n=1 Tax=Streptomyces sp. NPDC059866 TaxID=3346978 RepID=UPI0036544911
MTYFVKYLPVTTGNSTRLYTDGRDYCADLYEDLRSAKKFVFLTGLHFMAEFGLIRTGKPSDAVATLAQVLRQTGERGVQVFLLVNQFWRDESEVITGGHPIRAKIMKAGELYGYLPETLKLFDSLKGLKNVHCRTDIHPNSDIFATHHQKTVVIDDRVAFLGGIDLTYLDGDRWDTSEHTARHRHVDRTQKFWHDVHLRLQGPAVEFVRDNFLQRWNHGSLHTIRKKSLNSYEAWSQHIGEDPRHVAVEATQDRRPPALPPFAQKSVLSYTYPADGEEPAAPTVQIVRSMPRKDNWHRQKPTWNTNRSDEWEHSCKEAYLIGIRSANKYIYLENQWVADEDIWAELAAAARRNKNNPDFRIILMVPYEGLFAAGLGSNQELFIGTEMEDVIKASRSPATFGMYALHQHDRRSNVQGQIYIHSKVLIIDDAWSLIGSANAGGISLEGVRSGRDEPDTELSAIIHDKAFASAFRSKVWSEHLGVPVGPTYDVHDADRFRGLANKPGGKLRFFPGYDNIKRGVPTWFPESLQESRDPLRIDFAKQSRIIPSLSRDLLASGLPPTLVRAAFTARVVPSVPPGWRCWYRWHCQLHYDPTEPSGRDPRRAPVYLKLRSLKYDRDEVWNYSDQDSVYIGKLSAERINAETTTAVLGVIRCRVKILPLDEGPNDPGPSMVLQFECMFLNDRFARGNHPDFVRR